MNIARDGTKPPPGRDIHRPPNTSGHADVCVCYVLSYRAPNYIRTLSLLRALKTCRGIRVVSARNTHKGPWRYVETWRSLLRVRSSTKPDAYVLGFRGHEIFWLVRWIAGGKPLIIDALMSPYAALQEEGKGGILGKMLAPALRRMECHALSRADAVLTDTQLHADYFARTFGISPNKIISVPVGAIEAGSSGPTSSVLAGTEVFSVLFYGSFLALHGIDVIINAAARLKDLPIRFDFIGGRRFQEKRFRRACAQLQVSGYTYRRWVRFDRLLTEEIPRASVCLGGPFGGTPQARRVVTGKTSQCLALGKATMIGRIDEDYGFADRVNCLLVEQDDAASLAAGLRWAYENRAALGEIGTRGKLLYDERLSIRVTSKRLSDALELVGVTNSRSES